MTLHATDPLLQDATLRRWVLGLALALAACTTQETVVLIDSDLGPAAEDSASQPADTAAPPADTAPEPQETAVAPDSGPATTFSIPCPAGLTRLEETEPNDHWTSSNALGVVVTPGFCIQGRVLCGNDGKDGYGNPGDHFSFELGTEAKVDFELRWDATSDFDLLISSDFDGGTLDVKFKSGVGVPEGGAPTLDADKPYYISVNCWEGTPGDFALVATW